MNIRDNNNGNDTTSIPSQVQLPPPPQNQQVCPPVSHQSVCSQSGCIGDTFSHGGDRQYNQGR
jgi:hypothetical protein